VSAPSFVTGWQRARQARRVAVGAWLGHTAIALPLALALASALDPLDDLAAAPGGVPAGSATEAFVQFGLATARAGGPLVFLLFGTFGLWGVWQLVWQNGLALSWREGERTRFRAAVAAGWLYLPTFLWLAVVGLLVQAAAVVVGVIVGLPLIPLAKVGPWWIPALLLPLRFLLGIAGWLLGVAALQHARWSVAAGVGPLRAMLRGVRTVVRSPLPMAVPAAVWLAWSLGWSLIWLAARVFGQVGGSAQANVAFALMLAVAFLQTWGRAALLLAYAHVPVVETAFAVAPPVAEDAFAAPPADLEAPVEATLPVDGAGETGRPEPEVVLASGEEVTDGAPAAVDVEPGSPLRPEDGD
jgi:hypothetical protein